MQRYCRKWKKAVPGLKEFAHLLQIPEDARSKILGGFQVYLPVDVLTQKVEKLKIREGKSEPRPSGLPILSPLKFHTYRFHRPRTGLREWTPKR